MQQEIMGMKSITDALKHTVTSFNSGSAFEPLNQRMSRIENTMLEILKRLDSFGSKQLASEKPR